MPILDPSLQYFLLNNESKQKNNKNGYSFFFKYLKIASKNKSRNNTTIWSSIQFKKDLQSSISFLNEEFECGFKYEKHFANLKKNQDYYEMLFNKIKFEPDTKKLQESKKSIGTYLICDDNFNTKFYQPCVFFPKYHSWYLSDTPVAILCIDSEKFVELDDKIIQKIFTIIKLEIDLMVAANLTLILCYNGLLKTESFFYQLIQDHQFSELHINIFNDQFLERFLLFMNRHYFSSNNYLNGYMYLYSNFLNENSENYEQMQIFRRIPNVKTVSFSMHPREALIKRFFVTTKPFQYYKTGFDSQHLRVILCNVAIFEQNEKVHHTKVDLSQLVSLTEYEQRVKSVKDLRNKIATETSNLCVGYIKQSDFLNSKEEYVYILIDDEKHRKLHYDVHFEDLHLIRPSMFVIDSLSLCPIEEGMHKDIEMILSKVDAKIGNLMELVESTKSNKKIKKLKKKSFSTNYFYNLVHKEYVHAIARVAFAYTYFMREKDPVRNIDFRIRNQQIYTVLEACKKFFNDNSNTATIDDSKGSIFQIKTGEGKSCIVCLIAATLALKGKTVHIVSSNIKLSNRDYIESFEFFKMLNKKSAILLHQNELPYFESVSSIENEMNELKKNFYPDCYYADEHFENTSKMNFSTCGVDSNNNEYKGKANVVFSTFVNFECFYLFLMENFPAYIEKYFEECGMLIDEADSILIDEITNGTIISREMKTNAKRILSLVYNLKEKKDKNKNEILERLKEDPICRDIEIGDVRRMLKDEGIVNRPEFQDGKKYLVESFQVKNKKRISNFIKKTKNCAKKIKSISLGIPRKVISQLQGDEEEEDDDDNNVDFDSSDEDDDEEDDDEKLSTEKFIEFKRIVPYDYENKGMIERNKEFDGFIPQFIYLKECQKNENLIFKDISISYLYISHPIFAKLYNNICGFTGTIGTKDDKKIFADQYKLNTKNVPRHKPSLRVDFPLTAFDSVYGRNESIVNEILAFHKKGNPVLVIFKYFYEINNIVNKINERYPEVMNTNKKPTIYVFNGKEEYLRPDKIAGHQGSITLGSNICGRGTDIRCSQSYPLHVIIAYSTFNERTMEQVFGRTARNGQVGTCHCICLKDDLNQKSILTLEKVNEIVTENDIKTKKQKEFIDEFKATRPWIFEPVLKNKDFDKKGIKESFRQLRSSIINVNRIIACGYTFPLIMKYDTFISIQAQRIFSIFNCPNCKYTWRIFQRYVREMILQSWTLMIKKFDQQTDENSENESLDKYEERLNEEIDKLKKSLYRYFPSEAQSNDKFIVLSDGSEMQQFDVKEMVPTFLHICSEVMIDWEAKIRNSFSLNKYFIFIGNPTQKVCLQVGFKPYSLLSKSGVRITNENMDDANFISDPELSYEKKMPHKKFIPISITERIDEIFDKILQAMNKKIAQKFFVKFFLRRTLAGAEFGIFLDLSLRNKELEKEIFLLADKSPLLVGTIYVWSFFPIFVGILIILLIYLIGVAKQIAEIIACPELKLSEIIGEKIIAKIEDKIKESIEGIIPKLGDIIFGKIIDFLKKILEKLIDELENKFCDDIMPPILKTFLDILEGGSDSDDGDNDYRSDNNKKSNLFERIIGHLGSLIKIPTNVGDFLNDFADAQNIVKMSILLLLCLTAFIRRFSLRRKAISNAENDSKQYDESFKSDKETRDRKIDEIEKKREKEENLENVETNLDQNEMSNINQSLKDIEKTGIFKILTFDVLSKFEVKAREIKTKSFINQKGICIHLPTNKIFKKTYTNLSKDFCKLYNFLSTNTHPVIAPFCGFLFNNERSILFLEFNPKCVLPIASDKRFYKSFYEIFNRKKIIFLYGIASAMEFLHRKQMDTFRLDPLNIILDENEKPQIVCFNSEFVKEDEEDFPELTPPEMKSNPKNYDIYKANVYLLGSLLFYSSNEPSESRIVFKSSSEYFNTFHQLSFENELIIKCTNPDPDKRPTFLEICEAIESRNTLSDELKDYIKCLKKFRESDNFE